MKDNILDLFDSIAIIGISVVLAMAFYYQLYFQELPVCLMCVPKNVTELINFWITTKLVAW